MKGRVICGLLPVTLPLGTALADRGMIFIGRPSVSIYEPGQKAIVAWNRGMEVLILATDTRAPQEGKALGVLPLPSAPKVEKGSLDSFVAVQRLIWKNALRLSGAVRGKISSPQGVRIVFRKRIGAHNLTAVEAGSVQAFIRWAEEFVRKHARSNLGALPAEWRATVADYIKRGVRFFVFDLIDIGREERTIEPLVYTFKSRRPFYPLKISRPMGGLTKVQVFLLTPKMPDIFSMRGPLAVATYKAPFGWRPILFKVSYHELKAISPKISSLLGKGGGYLCALQYKGPTSGLYADLEIRGFLRAVALSLKLRRRG